MPQLRVNDTCYICAKQMIPAEREIEHVVPKGMFCPEDRHDLITLPAHPLCNRSYSKDDEYFRLCMTTAAPHDPKALRLWSGPVLRGFHRPQSSGFKTAVLDKLSTVDAYSEGGIYLGTAHTMLQKADRITRVVMRITRGLHGHLTGQVLPADWPVACDLMDSAKLRPYAERLQFQLRDIGNGTFYYGWKHLDGAEEEGLFWMVFYRSVHFWGYSGQMIRSRLPWHSGGSD